MLNASKYIIACNLARRGRRSASGNTTKILSSILENVKLSDFESGLHGDTAAITEETLEQWENEFFVHVLQVTRLKNIHTFSNFGTNFVTVSERSRSRRWMVSRNIRRFRR